VASSRDAVGAWRPFGVPARVSVLRSDVACESCHRRECESLICLRLIEPEHVLSALSAMNVAVANGPQARAQGQPD
ncbi:MAG TPA: hypothetical protein VHO25_24270, partial [Polyangiaceae bacterium]|nr:hypothetical protein [Polyangiaceae bacterium]